MRPAGDTNRKTTSRRPFPISELRRFTRQRALGPLSESLFRFGVRAGTRQHWRFVTQRANDWQIIGLGTPQRERTYDNVESCLRRGFSALGKGANVDRQVECRGSAYFKARSSVYRQQIGHCRKGEGTSAAPKAPARAGLRACLPILSTSIAPGEAGPSQGQTGFHGLEGSVAGLRDLHPENASAACLSADKPGLVRRKSRAEHGSPRRNAIFKVQTPPSEVYLASDIHRGDGWSESARPFPAD